MLHIHKDVNGNYWISLEIQSDGHTVMTFSGTFQRVGDEESESDKTLTINVPTLGDK